MSLSKAQILAASDPRLLEVQVPEWGGSVFVRMMTVGERDAYEVEYSRAGGGVFDDYRTKFLAKCLADEKGNRLFTDAEVVSLREKNAAVMNRLFLAATKHNDVDEARVQEVAKNS